MTNAIHFVVVKTNKAKDYAGGLGYQGPELRRLGFPEAPYSLAGAKTLVRQAQEMNPRLRLSVVPFIGEYWGTKHG